MAIKIGDVYSYVVTCVLRNDGNPIALPVRKTAAAMVESFSDSDMSEPENDTV